MPCSVTKGGTEFEVWVQPRASRNQVCGLQGKAVRVRVAAPPVDGEANAVLVRFLAKRLGVATSAVEIVRGRTGRRKTVGVEGLSPQEVRSRLGI